jgi:hypothetical protein
VQHWPTWYNDPFADKGSDNRQFGISGEDFLAVPYCIARFCVNTGGLPASIIVEPPWKKMYSDGRVGTLPFKEHDEASSPLATANGATMEEPLVAPDTVRPRTQASESPPLVPVADAATQPAYGRYQPLNP